MSPRLLSALCLFAAGVGFQSAGLFTRGALEPGRGAAAQPADKGSRQPAAGGGAAATTSGEGHAQQRLRNLREATGLSHVTSPADPKLLNEQLQAMSWLSEITSPADLKLSFMEAVNQFAPEELAEQLSRVAESANLFRTIQPDFEYAARRLSEIAPEKAAELWLKRKDGLLGGEALLAPWANQHPEAFVAWSLGLPEDAQKAAAGVLRDLARGNPEQFAALASQLAQAPGGVAGARGAIRGLFQGGGKQPDPAAALAYAKGLPEGPVRSAALAETAQAYGLDQVSLAANPEVRGALAALGPAEARTVGQQFAAVADRLPQGPVRESAFAAQMNTSAKKDPQAAAKKVEALSGSADYPAAVRGFVEATAAKDPAAALDWALSIGPQGGQRTAALEKAAAEYFRQKPNEARRWVTSASLSAEEYFLLTGFRR
jgi:hypothetical protein